MKTQSLFAFTLIVALVASGNAMSLRSASSNRNRILEETAADRQGFITDCVDRAGTPGFDADVYYYDQDAGACATECPATYPIPINSGCFSCAQSDDVWSDCTEYFAGPTDEIAANAVQTYFNDNTDVDAEDYGEWSATMDNSLVFLEALIEIDLTTYTTAKSEWATAQGFDGIAEEEWTVPYTATELLNDGDWSSLYLCMLEQENFAVDPATTDNCQTFGVDQTPDAVAQTVEECTAASDGDGTVPADMLPDWYLDSNVGADSELEVATCVAECSGWQFAHSSHECVSCETTTIALCYEHFATDDELAAFELALAEEETEESVDEEAATEEEEAAAAEEEAAAAEEEVAEEEAADEEVVDEVDRRFLQDDEEVTEEEAAEAEEEAVAELSDALAECLGAIEIAAETDSICKTTGLALGLIEQLIEEECDEDDEDCDDGAAELIENLIGDDLAALCEKLKVTAEQQEGGMTEIELITAQAAYNDCLAEAAGGTDDTGSLATVGVTLLATAALFW